MTLLELIKSYMGTKEIAPIASGLKGYAVKGMLDCDCVNNDCCTESYES